jgi:hypothetical protein
VIVGHGRRVHSRDRQPVHELMNRYQIGLTEGVPQGLLALTDLVRVVETADPRQPRNRDPGLGGA